MYTFAAVVTAHLKNVHFGTQPTPSSSKGPECTAHYRLSNGPSGK